MLRTLTAAAASAGLMYLFDPDQGRRRRAMLADQCRHATHQSQRELDKALRDLQNRMQGFVAEVRTNLSHEPVSDEVLAARVRSKLGRYASHPSAIGVECTEGLVTLSGPILANEAGPLASAIGCLHGVQSVDDQLERHNEPGNISALQGAGQARGRSYKFAAERWTPATKLLAVIGGGTLGTYLLARRSPGTLVLGGLGIGLCATLMSNRDLQHELMNALSPEQAASHQDAQRQEQRQTTPA